MKVREIRELNHDEIKSRIDDSRKSIVELRFQLAMRKLESPAKLRQARKQLARLLTLQTEKTDQEIGVGQVKSESDAQSAKQAAS
jgi:large subunit ribosomal protein L29